MPKYIVSPKLEIYVSDSDFKADDKIGFDPKDMNNVAYQPPYNKPYSLYSSLGGFNVRPPIPTQPGDIFDVNIDNSTTNSPSNSNSYTLTISQTSKAWIIVGMPNQKLHAPGRLDIYGSVTRASTNTVYVFTTANLDQVLP